MAKNTDYTILEFDDFDWSDNTMEDNTIKENKMTNTIYNVPNHYKMNGQDTMRIIVDIVKKNTSDVEEAVYLFNILKYILRYGDKNGIADLKKAKDFMHRLIDYMEE